MDMERFLYPLLNLKSKTQKYSIFSVLPFLNKENKATSVYIYLSVCLPTLIFSKRSTGRIRQDIYTAVSEK